MQSLWPVSTVIDGPEVAPMPPDELNDDTGEPKIQTPPSASSSAVVPSRVKQENIAPLSTNEMNALPPPVAKNVPISQVPKERTAPAAIPALVGHMVLASTQNLGTNPPSQE